MNSLSLSLWYFGLIHLFLLISMLLDLLVARVGCGVVWGDNEIQRGICGVPLMIMMTNEYHEMMHACLHACTCTCRCACTILLVSLYMHMHMHM